MEDVKVTIKDALWLGFCLGLGFGLALVFYAIIALAAVRLYFDAALRAPSRQVTTYRASPPQLDMRGDPLESREAAIERLAPSETFDEMLERVEREAEEMSSGAWWGYDPNKR